mgnify:CR=1 FL=1
MFLAPLQSPLAVQAEGALVTDHVSVMLAPGVTGPTGLLANEVMGRSGGGVVTATVAVAYPEPTLLVQVNL